MNRADLEAPFDEHLIKTRPGANGRPLSYVEGAEYIRRLNDAFDGRWSFEVVEYKVVDREVVVVGRLEAEGIIKTAFGGAQIKTSHQTGEPLNLGDDCKAAATDALKKASSLFGVGLHLYSKDGAEAPSGRAADSPAPSHGAPSRGRGQSPLTERQLKAIMAISRALGWTPDRLRSECVDRFKTPPEELDRADASTFIGELQGMSTKAAS